MADFKLQSVSLSLFPFDAAFLHNILLVMPRSPADPPVAEWSTLWKDMQPTLAKIRRSMITARTTPIKVMRVSQLDSDILDSELFSILKEQLWSALSLFKASIDGGGGGDIGRVPCC